MKHELLLLGKTKADYIEQGVDDFTSRLKHYTSLELRFLKEKKGKIQQDRSQEGQQLLSAVPGGWLKVVLDGGGRQYSSEEFAELISGWEQRGVKGACYLIGGPTGHSEQVIRQADCVLSLSKMTFTHDMIRLLLIEQIYRAYTIKAGEKYHK